MTVTMIITASSGLHSSELITSVWAVTICSSAADDVGRDEDFVSDVKRMTVTMTVGTTMTDVMRMTMTATAMVSAEPIMTS